MKNKIYYLLLFFIISFSPALSQWEETNYEDLNYDMINCIVAKDSLLFVGTVYTGIYLSTNNGDNWKKINTGLARKPINSITISADKMFAGTFGNGVYLSTDNGQNWISANGGQTNAFISSIAIDGDNIFAGTVNKGVYKTTNDGNEWQDITQGINPEINVVAVNDGIIYVGANPGCNNLPSMFISTDGGDIWNTIDRSETNLSDITSYTFYENQVFANDAASIIKSTNNGFNWQTIFDGIGNNILIYELAMIDKHIIFGGFKVLVSSDFGINWIDKSIGLLDSVAINDFAYNDKYIFAATDFGVFRAKKIDIITSVNSEQPKQTSSFNIYPIPTSDYLYIHNQNYNYNNKIIISSVTGEVLLTVEDNNREEQKINIQNLSPGIYFLRIGNVCKKFIVNR